MMVTEITLINCREYAWSSGLALYREMNPSRARNTAAPEMSPTKRNIICTVLEYSFIFSYWPMIWSAMESSVTRPVVQ